MAGHGLVAALFWIIIVAIVFVKAPKIGGKSGPEQAGNLVRQFTGGAGDVITALEGGGTAPGQAGQ